MRTVISHFYNEEYLLPFWLRHHRALFDHGILIDRHSTDRSAEIVRALAPEWTLVRSETADFDAIECDFEVMLHERTVPGWKIALTTTEFLCCPHLDAAEALAESHGAQGFCFEAAIMVDPPAAAPSPLRPDLPLPVQRTHGYFEHEHPRLIGRIPYHYRLYHCFPHGSYHPGRHLTHRAATRMPDLGVLLWYGFSPWTEPFIRRKLQVGAAIPPSDVAAGRGRQHLMDRTALEERRRALAAVARDLRREPLFRASVALPGPAA